MEETQGFKITLAGIYDSHSVYPHSDGYVTPLRHITQYEIEIFERDGGVAFLNEESRAIQKGGILIARPGDVRHSILHFRVYYLHLDVYDKSLAAKLNGLPHFLETTREEEYFPLIADLASKNGMEFAGKEFYLASQLYRLLYMLTADLDTTRHAELGGIDPAYLCAAAQFMEHHFAEPLTLSEVAKKASLSPIYFHKRFKAFTGKTPHEYLCAVRLAEAKKLLTLTDLPVAEIAARTGFSSQSYFNAFFKKSTAISPLAFRKQALEKYRA